MLLGSHRWHWNTAGDLRRTGKRAEMGCAMGQAFAGPRFLWPRILLEQWLRLSLRGSRPQFILRSPNKKNHFALLEALRPVLIFFVTFVALLSGVDVSDM